MKTARLAFSVLAVLMLAAGYAASQVAALNGSSADYAHLVDMPPVRALALSVLLAAIVFALMRDRGEDP